MWKRPVAKTKAPQKVQSALWARAAGRCQYRGCNQDLVGDLISGNEDALFGFMHDAKAVARRVYPDPNAI